MAISSARSGVVVEHRTEHALRVGTAYVVGHCGEQQHVGGDLVRGHHRDRVLPASAARWANRASSSAPASASTAVSPLMPTASRDRARPGESRPNARRSRPGSSGDDGSKATSKPSRPGRDHRRADHQRDVLEHRHRDSPGPSSCPVRQLRDRDDHRPVRLHAGLAQPGGDLGLRAAGLDQRQRVRDQRPQRQPALVPAYPVQRGDRAQLLHRLDMGAGPLRVIAVDDQQPGGQPVAEA